MELYIVPVVLFAVSFVLHTYARKALDEPITPKLALKYYIESFYERFEFILFEGMGFALTLLALSYTNLMTEQATSCAPHALTVFAILIGGAKLFADFILFVMVASES